jgi:16S rRNA (guanine527-N7)-methyltransferase
MESTENYFSNILNDLGLHLSSPTLDKLFSFIKILLETNKTLNLTAIKDYQEALIKHIYDALLIINMNDFRTSDSIIDIGSGAGIPVIPLAIAFPDKHFFSLEATQKKVKFQIETCQTLEINNCHPLWGRAEELANHKEHRESYDLVIARAVASANILTEITIPFAKVGGHVIFYKGKGYQEEIHNAKRAFQELNGSINEIYEALLPFEYGERSLISITKVDSTNSKYPRQPGIPQKKPL